jgi:hypothetical protein
VQGLAFSVGLVREDSLEGSARYQVDVCLLLFRVQGSGFRVQGSGFRVQGSGFRVQGSGFRVQGLGVPSPAGTTFRVSQQAWHRFNLGPYQIPARYLRLPTLKIRVDMLS